MKTKYKKGKSIKNFSDFENSKSLWYKVLFGNKEKTVHRMVLEHWQYHTLCQFIKRGWVYEADIMENDFCSFGRGCLENINDE